MRCPLGLVALLVTIFPLSASAQDVRDAETLPAGVGAVLIQPGLGYGPGSLERFGRGWQFSRESLIADFNGVSLSKVLVGDAASGIQIGGGTLGVTNFVGKQQSFAVNFMAAVGITDRLTLAALWPFMSVDYELDVWLSREKDEATGMELPLANARIKEDFKDVDCANLDIARDFDKIVDLDPGASYQFNVDDLRRALVSDCLGYRDPVDRLEIGSDGYVHGKGNRRFSGFRDLVLGAKYQVFHGRDLHLAGLAYVIAPTGKVEDPTDLFDVNFGDGQWDAALLAAVTVPFDDIGLRVAVSAGYEISFADSLERRLNSLTFEDSLEEQLAKGELSEQQLFDEHLDEGTAVPIVTRYDSATIDRKLGDSVYVYSGVSYQILEWLSVGVTLDLLHHFRDRVKSIGPRPSPAPPWLTEEQIRAEVAADPTLDTDAKRLTELKARLRESDGRKKAAYAWHTVRGSLVGGIGVNFNTIPMFIRGDFPLPILASIGASRFLAGQNLDTPDAVSLSIALPLPFFLLTGDEPKEMPFDDEPEGESEELGPPEHVPPVIITPPDRDSTPTAPGAPNPS
ncbi:MAG: transporter [Deltaproteobacteria bacterium]|nr:transporter [Deltaproteobacteria bacterium]